MTNPTAVDIVTNGCDHPPRVGGWCLPCDRIVQDATSACPCRPENGGSGICGCVLGGLKVTC